MGGFFVGFFYQPECFYDFVFFGHLKWRGAKLSSTDNVLLLMKTMKHHIYGARTFICIRASNSSELSASDLFYVGVRWLTPCEVVRGSVIGRLCSAQKRI